MCVCVCVCARACTCTSNRLMKRSSCWHTVLYIYLRTRQNGHRDKFRNLSRCPFCLARNYFFALWFSADSRTQKLNSDKFDQWRIRRRMWRNMHMYRRSFSHKVTTRRFCPQHPTLTPDQRQRSAGRYISIVIYTCISWQKAKSTRNCGARLRLAPTIIFLVVLCLQVSLVSHVELAIHHAYSLHCDTHTHTHTHTRTHTHTHTHARTHARTHTQGPGNMFACSWQQATVCPLLRLWPWLQVQNADVWTLSNIKAHAAMLEILYLCQARSSHN